MRHYLEATDSVLQSARCDVQSPQRVKAAGEASARSVSEASNAAAASEAGNVRYEAPPPARPLALGDAVALLSATF